MSLSGLNPIERFFITSLGVSLDTGIRYAFFAGIAWVLGYVLLRRRWWHRKIVARMPSSSEVGREMFYSALTLVIFGVVGAATAFAVIAGWTQVYFQVEKYGYGWLLASFVLTVILHDTYFYWTHRLMHHPRLFRVFHRVHHQSTNPSPWAAYSFGPLEALVQAGIFPLAVLAMPIHPFAFIAFMTWQITFNVIGHTGYEIFPSWLMDSWLGKILNTPTNHVMHHEYFRGNYGIYFNVWDRLMGTNHERYEERFKQVTSGNAGSAVPRSHTTAPVRSVRT